MFKSPNSRYQVSLFKSPDDDVSQNSHVRAIDLIVDSILKKSKLDYLDNKGMSRTGRPAYSFSVLLKLLIYGYMKRIHSCRSLAEQCHYNLEIKWLIGDLTPDFRTIAVFRKDYRKEIKDFSKAFRLMLKDLKLFSGEYSIDGSKIKANANPEELINFNKIQRRLSEIDTQMNVYLDKLENQDKDENHDYNMEEELLDNPNAIKKKISSLESEMKELHDKLHLLESQNAKNISPTEPDCRLMKSRDGYIPGYNAQIAVDTKYGFIASDDIGNYGSDINQLSPVVDDIKSELEVYSLTAIGDKGYFNLNDLPKLSFLGIELYVAVPKQQAGRDKFIYDKENDRYVCPEGKYLNFYQNKNDKSRKYPLKVYLCKDCKGCSRRRICTKSSLGRRFNRHFYEDFRVEFTKKMQSVLAKDKLFKRKCSVECVFGSLKIMAGKIPLLTRNLSGVKTEFKLMCLGYNFKHLLNMFSYDKIKQLLSYYYDKTLYIFIILFVSGFKRLWGEDRLLFDYQ